MSGPAFLDLATTIGFVLLGLAFLLVFLRLILGPTLADRILALDTLTVLAAAAIVTFTLKTGLYAYLDIAVAISLLGLVSTIALARYLISRGDK